jgi:hypothetical protein
VRVRPLLAAAGLAVIVFALVFFHPPGKSGLLHRDFESYYGGGATWRYGGDPYSREVWRTERTLPDVVATRDELLPFVGPPFGLPLWSILSRLPWDAATLLWGGVMGISLATIVFAAVAFGGYTTMRVFVTRAFAGFVFAASFAPLTSGVALGQVAIVSCAAVALVPFALRGRRSIAATLLASLVAALQPTIAFALAARIATVRSAIAIVGAALLAALGSQLALARYGGLVHYASILAEHSAAERAIAIQTTIGAVARGFGASPYASAVIAVTIALVALAILAWQCVWNGYAPDDRLLLASAALPLMWTFGHEHDFAIVLMPVIVVLVRTRGIAWYVTAFGAAIVATDWLGLAQRPTGDTFEALRTLGGGIALAALAPGERVTWRALAPASVGIAALGAGVLAAAHPVNVWPDRLPLDFHVPLAYDAAATWGAEQLRSGVAHYDATNAFLRTLSLIGCALVWIGASLALRRSGRLG